MGGDPFDYTYYQANTDWQDAIFQNAMISQTTASIMGANEKSNFYLGVGYTYEQGSIVGEEMQKVTVNFSDEYKMKDWLKFGVQMNGAYMLPADAKNVTGAIHAAPISPIYDDTTGGYYKLPSVPEFADLQPDDRHRGVRRPQQGAELPLRRQCLRRDQFPCPN